MASTIGKGRTVFITPRGGQDCRPPSGSVILSASLARQGASSNPPLASTTSSLSPSAPTSSSIEATFKAYAISATRRRASGTRKGFKNGKEIINEKVQTNQSLLRPLRLWMVVGKASILLQDLLRYCSNVIPLQMDGYAKGMV